MTQTQKTILEVVLRIGERFGVPCLLMLAVLWMLREGAASLHHTVIVPVVSAHSEFLSSTQETLREIGRTQEKQAEAMQELAAGQQRIEHAVTAPPRTKVEN